MSLKNNLIEAIGHIRHHYAVRNAVPRLIQSVELAAIGGLVAHLLHWLWCK